jgi:hypothetical protein
MLMRISDACQRPCSASAGRKRTISKSNTPVSTSKTAPKLYTWAWGSNCIRGSGVNEDAKPFDMNARIAFASRQFFARTTSTPILFYHRTSLSSSAFSPNIFSQTQQPAEPLNIPQHPLFTSCSRLLPSAPCTILDWLGWIPNS